MPFNIRVDISGAIMHGSYILCQRCYIFKILQEYKIKKSQFTSIILAPLPLGELASPEREIHIQ